MNPVFERAGLALARWMDRRAEGSTLRFQDPSTCPPPVLVPQARPANPLGGPAAAAPTGLRPGAGWHADHCAYLDDPWHRCVNESGQPSNLACHATEARWSRIPFDTLLCLVCHQPTASHDQICAHCAQEVA